MLQIIAFIIPTYIYILGLIKKKKIIVSFSLQKWTKVMIYIYI